MPRGKVPSLLSTNNGGITYDYAKKSGQCSRCKTSISNGSKVGLMKVSKSGFTNNRRMCITCTSEVVDKTQQELDVIKHGLDL